MIKKAATETRYRSPPNFKFAEINFSLQCKYSTENFIYSSSASGKRDDDTADLLNTAGAMGYITSANVNSL